MDKPSEHPGNKKAVLKAMHPARMEKNDEETPILLASNLFFLHCHCLCALLSAFPRMNKQTNKRPDFADVARRCRKQILADNQ